MFTDIHSHILNGVDDGSESFQITKDMIRIAMEDGIDTMFATPHFIAGVSLHKPALREKAFRFLRDYIEENKLPIRLLPGNEIYLDEQSVNMLKKGQCLPLGSSRYVLLEFSLSDVPINLESILENIQQNGYRPILAHPERCGEFMADPARIEGLLRQGCLIQVNTGSVTGFYGSTVQKASRRLFGSGWVHFIGTDAHTNRSRSPKMMAAYRTVIQWVGDEAAKRIFVDNPRLILEDKPYIYHEPAAKHVPAAGFFKMLSRRA